MTSDIVNLALGRVLAASEAPIFFVMLWACGLLIIITAVLLATKRGLWLRNRPGILLRPIGLLVLAAVSQIVLALPDPQQAVRVGLLALLVLGSLFTIILVEMILMARSRG